MNQKEREALEERLRHTLNAQRNLYASILPVQVYLMIQSVMTGRSLQFIISYCTIAIIIGTLVRHERTYQFLTTVRNMRAIVDEANEIGTLMID